MLSVAEALANACRRSAVSIIDVDDWAEELKAAQKDDPPTVHPSILFYRGECPIQIVGISTDEGEYKEFSNGDRPTVPLDVMTFHRLMLPPNIDIHAPYDRVADRAEIDVFEDNFLKPCVLQTDADESNPLLISQGLRILFPSLSEDLSVRCWRELTTNGAMLDRLHYSYTILLHFFGWRLHDEETGVVDRHKNWKDRYDFLAPASPTNGTVTLMPPTTYYILWSRMLRVLIELKMSNYASRWLFFLLEEFRGGRLRFLVSVWDAVWMPMVIACTAVTEDTAALLKKKRRRMDVDSDDDDDDDA